MINKKYKGRIFKRRFNTFAAVFAVLSLLAILATWPEPTTQLDYKVRPGNDAKLMLNDASDTGVLLIHGFGASPWEMQQLAEYLYGSGYTVYNMRVAGHGTSVADFGKTTSEEWYQSVSEAYTALKGVCSHIYVIGLSAGGNLALMLAENEQLDGVVAVNAPIWLRDKKAKFAPVAKYFIKAVDKELSDEEKPYCYSKRPLTAVNELLKTIDDSADGLGKIEEKTLVLQSKYDPTVEPKSGEFIYSHLKNGNGKLKWYDLQEHVIVRGDSAKAVFPDILSFIRS